MEELPELKTALQIICETLASSIATTADGRLTPAGTDTFTEVSRRWSSLAERPEI